MEKYPKKEPRVTLFTGGLHPRTKETELYDIISQVTDQQILEIRLPQKKGRKIKSIAFIDIPTKEIGETIIRHFKNKKVYLHDRRITFAFSNKSEADKQKKEKMRLFMPRIPKDIADDIILMTLKDKEKLDVRSAYQIYGIEGDPKGFGFIDFYQESHAEHLLNLGYFYLEGRIVEVEPYLPKSGSRKTEKKFYQNKKGNNFIEKSEKVYYVKKTSKKLHLKEVELQKQPEEKDENTKKSKESKPTFINPNTLKNKFDGSSPSFFSHSSSPIEIIKKISKCSFNLYGEIHVESKHANYEENYTPEHNHLELGKIFKWSKVIKKIVKKIRMRKKLHDKFHTSIRNYRLNKRTL